MFRAFRYQALAMPLTLEQAAQNCLSYLDFICSTLVDERTSRARRARKRYRYPRFRHPRRRSRDRPPARLRARRPQGEAARRLDSGASARADRPHRLHRHPPVRRLADGQARHRRRSLASPSARGHPDARFLERHRSAEGDYSTATDQHATGATATPARGYTQEQWAQMGHEEQKRARQRQFDQDAEEQRAWEAKARRDYEERRASDASA